MESKLCHEGHCLDLKAGQVMPYSDPGEIFLSPLYIKDRFFFAHL